MSASGPALAALVQSHVDSRMAAVRGFHPLSQRNPSYYIQMCSAIGNGIITGGPVINFITSDTGATGAPAVAGTGVGVGIVTDPTFFIQDLYTRIMGYIQADFGRTLHEPYPPSQGNSGEFLLALCTGINDAFLAYYPAAWTLTSTNPMVYAGSGVISNGQFSGLSAPTIKTTIQGLAPNFIGRFWPRIAQGVAESYVALIQQHSTGMVTITGSCAPGPSQVCGISGSGSGTGIAI